MAKNKTTFFRVYCNLARDVSEGKDVAEAWRQYSHGNPAAGHAMAKWIQTPGALRLVMALDCYFYKPINGPEATMYDAKVWQTLYRFFFVSVCRPAFA